MATMKVIELMADSTSSWEEATKIAIETAAKTIKNVRSAWVQDQSVVVDGGKVKSFRVSLKVSFEVN